LRFSFIQALVFSSSPLVHENRPEKVQIGKDAYRPINSLRIERSKNQVHQARKKGLFHPVFLYRIRYIIEHKTVY